MKKNELQQLLKQVHEDLCKDLMAMPAWELNAGLPGKWSAAQHADHLINSIRPLSKFMAAPKKLLAEKNGYSGRTSLNMEELRQKYELAMASGARAFGVFLPTEKNNFTAEALCSGVMQAIMELVQMSENWTEEELHEHLCPHPAMGLITVYEMLYFTVFHARHHHQSVLRCAGEGKRKINRV